MTNNNHNLLHLIMLDFPYMLQLKLRVVDRIHPQRNKYAKVVENKATGDSKIIVRPNYYQLENKCFCNNDFWLHCMSIEQQQIVNYLSNHC